MSPSAAPAHNEWQVSVSERLRPDYYTKQQNYSTRSGAIQVPREISYQAFPFSSAGQSTNNASEKSANDSRWQSAGHSNLLQSDIRELISKQEQEFFSGSQGAVPASAETGHAEAL